MKNLIIAPNSFKEVKNSVDISKQIAEIIKGKFNGEIITKPISDGGDGFLEVCKNEFSSSFQSYNITKSYSDELKQARVVFSEELKTVFIESAEILGLKVIPKKYRNPLINTSKGLGDLLAKLKENPLNIDKLIIGVGGTGTNDLCLGACSRFGLKLFDENDNELDVIPKRFTKVRNIHWKMPEFPFKIQTVVDVENPLTGEFGATRVFVKQKGASEKDIEILEEGIINIIKVLKEKTGIKVPEILSGAGGGLAAGLKIFFNADIRKASDFIEDDLGFNLLKNNVDFVITGEGSFDRQSFMNKGTGIILKIFKDTKTKVFLVCGVIEKESKEKLYSNVIPIELSSFFRNKEESINNFDKGIKLACEEILKQLKKGTS